jgi:outer membrane lipoprotein SlyB
MTAGRVLSLPLAMALAAAMLAAPLARAQAPAPSPAPVASPSAADLLKLPAPAAAPSPASAQPAAGCPECGRVESVRKAIVRDSWTPLGTGVGVGGAPVTGTAAGATSFSIGRGGANQGLVVLGAAGGASYQKTPGAYDRPRWEVTVKLDAGQTRVVSLAFEPYVREGDRVRVSGNSVELLD